MDVKNVGADQGTKTPVEAYDAAHGSYADPVEKIAESDRLQEGQMPKGPDKSPFTLGPLAGGERK